jgi:hypothetical protein
VIEVMVRVDERGDRLRRHLPDRGDELARHRRHHQRVHGDRPVAADDEARIRDARVALGIDPGRLDVREDLRPHFDHSVLPALGHDV